MRKRENHHMASTCNRALHRWGECVPGKEKQAIPLAVGALGPTISEIVRKSSKLRYINGFRFRYLLRSNSIYVVEVQDRKGRSRHVGSPRNGIQIGRVTHPSRDYRVCQMHPRPATPMGYMDCFARTRQHAKPGSHTGWLDAKILEVVHVVSILIYQTANSIHNHGTTKYPSYYRNGFCRRTQVTQHRAPCDR
jgi:hypothetical protein